MAKAKANKGEPAEPTPAQRARELRDGEIVAARSRALPWRQIAETYRLSERQCRAIWDEHHRRNPNLRRSGQVDPLNVVDELIAFYQGVAEEMAVVGATTQQDAVQVSAGRVKLDALDRLTVLLQAVGTLPSDLGALQASADINYMASAFYRLLDERNIPQDVRDEFHELLRPGAMQAGTPDQN